MYGEKIERKLDCPWEALRELNATKLQVSLLGRVSFSACWRLGEATEQTRISAFINHIKAQLIQNPSLAQWFVGHPASRPNIITGLIKT